MLWSEDGFNIVGNEMTYEIWSAKCGTECDLHLDDILITFIIGVFFLRMPSLACVDGFVPLCVFLSLEILSPSLCAGHPFNLSTVDVPSLDEPARILLLLLEIARKGMVVFF